uniref:Uncharacterized protein n=1 Tax=Anopheles farauti TaxID=69004 RepID=A0A182PZQ9_9DIPT
MNENPRGLPSTGSKKGTTDEKFCLLSEKAAPEILLERSPGAARYATRLACDADPSYRRDNGYVEGKRLQSTEDRKTVELPISHHQKRRNLYLLLLVLLLLLLLLRLLLATVKKG